MENKKIGKRGEMIYLCKPKKEGIKMQETKFFSIQLIEVEENIHHAAITANPQ